MKKSLKFTEDLIPLILSGEKTSTWRLFDDKDLTVGDELNLIDRSNGQSFGRAVIAEVSEKALGNLTLEDKEGHESFNSDQEMYNTYKNYYNQEVGPETIVKIVRFKLFASQ